LNAQASPSSRIAAVLRLLRPNQWTKNAFVLVGLLFAHAWDQPLRVHAALAAFAAFCAVASAVYVVNDWFDRDRDRQHPRKRERPIASGLIGGPLAFALAAGMFALGIALARSAPLHALPDGDGGARLVMVLTAYGLMNLGYSLGLKHVPILDCGLIALGFMLRIVAGTWAIGIEPSRWLIVCGLSVTLFLAFAKRRAELAALGDDAGAHREVLDRYSLPLLDQFLAITATAVLVTYSVYTVSTETIEIHGTDELFWTLPFVTYAMFRYLYLVFQRGAGGDPTRDLIADPHLVVSGLAWLVTTLWVLGAVT
jgi:4-hydroxybenzoate polyprenyltransferase